MVKKKFEVEYEVRYKKSIECERAELGDEISNIEIHETDDTAYVPDTFDVVNVQDEDGGEIPLEDI